MRDPRPAPAGRRRLGLAFALAATWAPAVLSAAEPASDLYYERAVMSAADARCRLFTPQLAAALAAAQAQARGAALRAGSTPQALKASAARAAAAAARQSCGSAGLQLAAARVRRAFEGYGRLLRMTFPGEAAAWRADRSLPSATPVWRLSETVPMGAGRVTFGLAGDWRQPAALVAVADFGPGERPYAARLLVRDPALAPEPYLGSAAGPVARPPLSARIPPRAATTVYPAEARAAAGPGLAPAGAGSALAFRFPAAAADALAGLDPREAVTLEFQVQGASGEIDRRAFIEVGDFAAGRAFLAAATR